MGSELLSWGCSSFQESCCLQVPHSEPSLCQPCPGRPFQVRLLYLSSIRQEIKVYCSPQYIVMFLSKAEDQKLTVGGRVLLKNKSKAPRRVLQVWLFDLAQNFVQTLDGFYMFEKDRGFCWFCKARSQNPGQKTGSALSLSHQALEVMQCS